MDIFKLIDSKFDITKKVRNLSRLLLAEEYFALNRYYVSFEKYFDEVCFKKWEHNLGCINLKDFKSEAGIFYEHSVNHVRYYNASNEIDAIKYLQYTYNIVMHAYKSTGYKAHLIITEEVKLFFEAFENSFNYIISKINQKVIEHHEENYYIIVPNNKKTNRAVELQTDDNIAYLLLEYTSFTLKRNVSRKREILKLLANTYEPTIKQNLRKYNSGPVHDVFDSLKSCLNNFNIRHNNLDPEDNKYYNEGLNDFTDEDFEKIYDVTYDLMLGATIINEYTNNNKSIYKEYIEKI